MIIACQSTRVRPFCRGRWISRRVSIRAQAAIVVPPIGLSAATARQPDRETRGSARFNSTTSRYDVLMYPIGCRLRPTPDARAMPARCDREYDPRYGETAEARAAGNAGDGSRRRPRQVVARTTSDPQQTRDVAQETVVDDVEIAIPDRRQSRPPSTNPAMHRWWHGHSDESGPPLS